MSFFSPGVPIQEVQLVKSVLFEKYFSTALDKHLSGLPYEF